MNTEKDMSEDRAQEGVQASDKRPDSYYVKLALRIAADFGASIAVPAIVAALVGVRLDDKYDSEPWLLVLCLLIAFVLTAIWLVKKAKRYKKLYDR